MLFKRCLALCLFLVALSFAQSPQQLVETLAAMPELDHAQWSVYARYVEPRNGEEAIIDHHSNMSLSCASSLKVLTVGIALDELGAGYTFETKLLYSGSIDDNGVLHGNIYIVGGGDPTLAGDQVWGVMNRKKLMSEWVKAIKKKGIRSVNGAVIADESMYGPYYVPGTWTWEDLGNYYGAGLSALCFMDNKYYLDFTPGKRVGDPAEVKAIRPDIPGFTYTNRMKTGPVNSGDRGYILGAPNFYHGIFHGTVPAGVETFTIKGSIPNPALLAAQSLEDALKTAKIPVAQVASVVSEPQPNRKEHLLKTVSSPPLERIAEITNKLSNNTFTEMLLLSLAHTENGNVDKPTKYIEKYLDKLKVDHDGMRLYDASGLSRENMITTKIFCDYLSAMAGRNSFRHFYNTFAVAGDNNDYGFVVQFAKNTEAAKNARVKTGYIGGVRSHTGYVQTRSGRLVAFSCMANNYHCKTSDITKLHEQVVAALAAME
jgi:serine-type D-Ala-D-Ala carboxypeptidase/endopeptidase (penicillin-binding protein 4)